VTSVVVPDRDRDRLPLDVRVRFDRDDDTAGAVDGGAAPAMVRDTKATRRA
jgi:hypothetical protein